jgi:tetratricopeptide (TPR) repeat protein
MMLATALLSLLLISHGVLAPESSVDMAQAQFASGNYGDAVKTLNTALASAPQDASIYHWLGRSYYEMQDFDKAISNAEEAVKLSSQNSEYLRWLGRAYGGKAEKSRSFFLARKVKQAFQAAVRLAPHNIQARRDLMQYCVEAPWIVGGDKEMAREQIDAISKLDPIEGRLARAAYFTAEKQWKAAESEYRAIVAAGPGRIAPYMEAAEFFDERKDAANLERTLEAAARIDSNDPRLQYYRGVSLILRGTQLATAGQLLNSYISNVRERSDYPSHRSAMEWLRQIDSKRSLENHN